LGKNLSKIHISDQTSLSTAKSNQNADNISLFLILHYHSIIDIMAGVFSSFSADVATSVKCPYS